MFYTCACETCKVKDLWTNFDGKKSNKRRVNWASAKAQILGSTLRIGTWSLVSTHENATSTNDKQEMHLNKQHAGL